MTEKIKKQESVFKGKPIPIPQRKPQKKLKKIQKKYQTPFGIMQKNVKGLIKSAKKHNPITKYYEEKEKKAKSKYFKNLNKTKPRTGTITDITKEHKVNPVTNKFEAVTSPPKEFKWNSDKEVYERIKTKKVKKAGGGKIGADFVSSSYSGFK